MKLAEDFTGYILVGDTYNSLPRINNDEAVAAYELAKETVNGFWTSVNRGEKVTCCEVVVGKYRFKVCVGMPDHIIAYMDYVEPQMEPVAKEVPMQYINRRDFMPDGVTRGDMALWPTFCPITSPGWVQIGAHPIDGRHEVEDTVLIFNRHIAPADKMIKRIVSAIAPDGVVEFPSGAQCVQEACINFSKGDHLTETEREAWHQEATGFQESYYSTFKP